MIKYFIKTLPISDNEISHYVGNGSKNEGREVFNKKRGISARLFAA
jgi:hypothetical protein